jgi:hypothetical protein
VWADRDEPSASLSVAERGRHRSRPTSQSRSILPRPATPAEPASSTARSPGSTHPAIPLAAHDRPDPRTGRPQRDSTAHAGISHQRRRQIRERLQHDDLLGPAPATARSVHAAPMILGLPRQRSSAATDGHMAPGYGEREASRSSPANAGERCTPGPPRADHRSTVRVVADRSAGRPVVHEIPDKRAHSSPAVNDVLRHGRCPTLQKWQNRSTKIDRSRSIRVGGYGPLLH